MQCSNAKRLLKESAPCVGSVDAFNSREKERRGKFERMRSSEFRANLFIANLPSDLTDEELAEVFDPYGIVLGAFMPRDPANGKPLGYGFVDIATQRAQEAAIAAMNGTELHGRRIEVRPSDRSRGVKKPPRSASQMRPKARPVEANEASGETTEGWAVMPPRKRPTFTVERRSLPRRI